MQAPIKRILCPVDFSETSLQALDYAQQLAQSLPASLVLCHAFDLPRSYDPADQAEPADAEVKRQLMELPTRIPVERRLHAGPAGEVVCWLADQEDCDLILMGTHGRTGLAHLLFGSVAEYVLTHATCPVMTIRLRKAKAEAAPEPQVMPLPAPRFM